MILLCTSEKKVNFIAASTFIALGISLLLAIRSYVTLAKLVFFLLYLPNNILLFIKTVKEKKSHWWKIIVPFYSIYI